MDKSGWQAMDIYLFCNGDEYSPPRKYHLTSEQLESWDSTQQFLAKSQYGSNANSILLHSLDGQKILNPMQLSNSATYVAVKSDDSFIYAGYQRYLAKATRSWEKRQALKNSNVEAINIDSDVNENYDDVWKPNKQEINPDLLGHYDPGPDNLSSEHSGGGTDKSGLMIKASEDSSIKSVLVHGKLREKEVEQNSLNRVPPNLQTTNKFKNNNNDTVKSEKSVMPKNELHNLKMNSRLRHTVPVNKQKLYGNNSNTRTNSAIKRKADRKDVNNLDPKSFIDNRKNNNTHKNRQIKYDTTPPNRSYERPPKYQNNNLRKNLQKESKISSKSNSVSGENNPPKYIYPGSTFKNRIISQEDKRKVYQNGYKYGTDSSHKHNVQRDVVPNKVKLVLPSDIYNLKKPVPLTDNKTLNIEQTDNSLKPVINEDNLQDKSKKTNLGESESQIPIKYPEENHDDDNIKKSAVIKESEKNYTKCPDAEENVQSVYLESSYTINGSPEIKKKDIHNTFNDGIGVTNNNRWLEEVKPEVISFKSNDTSNDNCENTKLCDNDLPVKKNSLLALSENQILKKTDDNTQLITNQSINYSSASKLPNISRTSDQIEPGIAKNLVNVIVRKGDTLNIKLNSNDGNIDGTVTVFNHKDQPNTNIFHVDESSQTNIRITFEDKSLNEIKNPIQTIPGAIASAPQNKVMPKVIVIQCPCCESISLSELKDLLPASSQCIARMNEEKQVFIISTSDTSKECKTFVSVECICNEYKDELPVPCRSQKDNVICICNEYEDKFNVPFRSQKDNVIHQAQAPTQSWTCSFNIDRCTCNEYKDDLNVPCRSQNDNLICECEEAMHYLVTTPNTMKKYLYSYKNKQNQIGVPERYEMGDFTKDVETKTMQPAVDVDASTETEWHETLLIPKMNEDGHYTFRLPPLELIKNM